MPEARCKVREIAGGGERQRDAVHDRHLDVGEQQVESAILAGQDLQRLGAVLGSDGLVAVHGDGARHQLAHRILVVGDQDFRHETNLGINLPCGTSSMIRKSA